MYLLKDEHQSMYKIMTFNRLFDPLSRIAFLGSYSSDKSTGLDAEGGQEKRLLMLYIIRRMGGNTSYLTLFCTSLQ